MSVPNCKHFDVCGLTDEADPEAGLCILHSTKREKSSDAFADALLAHRKMSQDFRAFVFPLSTDFSGANFAEEPSFAGATFVRGASFAGATFARGASFAGATFFVWAHFQGATFGGGAKFSNAKFISEAGFSGAQFTEEASFHGATFEEKANFSDATFAKRASFTMATFAEAAHFSNAIFAQGAGFISATFAKKARFSGAQFSDETNFYAATFTEKAHFSDATFVRGANLSGATFHGGVDFDGVAFQGGKVDFSNCALFGKTRFAPRRVRRDKLPVFGEAEVDFRAVRIEPPDAVAFVETNLGRCRFLDTDLRSVRLTGVTWAQMPWGVWSQVGARDAVYDEKKPEQYVPMPMAKIEDLYRQLKKNYEDQRDFDRAGDFHYGEKEMRRRNPGTPHGLQLLLTLYRWVSGYGELWLRPLTLFLVLLLAGAVGYLSCGVWVKDLVGDGGHLLGTRGPGAAPVDGLAALGQSVLFSLRVMTLLRPDDMVPVGWSRLIQTAQSLLGPLLMGLAGLAIRQRLRR